MEANYVTHMGDDLNVVNTARVSFANESWYIDKDYLPNKDHRRYQAWADYAYDAPLDKILSLEDFSLIHYLAEHGHWTPAAHQTIQLRMKAPVPIRTQCFKHKQGFIENEESRRYITSRPELFIPKEFRARPEGSIKQGSAGRHTRNEHWLTEYVRAANQAIDLYVDMVEDGVAPEQARFALPQGCEVNWIWTGSLYAYANLWKKRTDTHAQGEIRDLVTEVGSILAPLFPVAWPAFTK